ncbi:hypothetical protein V1522DRAFT_417437 [Lipomyces starkeyi]
MEFYLGRIAPLSLVLSFVLPPSPTQPRYSYLGCQSGAPNISFLNAAGWAVIHKYWARTLAESFGQDSRSVSKFLSIISIDRLRIQVLAQLQ